MGFNWFRRRYQDQSKSEQTEPAVDVKPEEAPKQSAPEQATEADAATSDPTTTAVDYLSWAKAAYQNIQQQQDTGTESAVKSTDVTDSAEAAPPQAAEQPEVTVASAESEASELSDAQPKGTVAPTSTSTESPTEEPTEAIALSSSLAGSAQDDAPELELATPEELGVDESLESETAIPAAPLPFFARAEAERQERLERLRAEALEAEAVAAAKAAAQAAPASIAEPTSTAAPVLDELPDLPFDEGFLWSAEVLAAQGRRPESVSVEEITWLQKLRQGLGKTRRNILNQLKAVVGQGPLNDDAVMEIESLLLQSDVGVEATDAIIAALQAKLREDALPPEEAIAYLKGIICEILDKPLQDVSKQMLAPEDDVLNVWLITGVNGAGKTTTIGKLAHLARKSDYTCLIAAGDTFRAAAVEQVKVWGERSGVEVIANPGQNTDPAAVVFDAVAAAQSRDTQLLLVDTAGRLQNKKNLMEELGKVRRIIDKKAPNAVVQSLLVLDATLGQNGVRQAEVFSEVAQLTGVILTKLDGTAKGGVALAVAQQLGLPIRFVGAGEGIEDLRPFSSYEFVEALLGG